MNDTDPRAAAFQIELLRRAGCKGRAAMAARLTDEMIRLSRRALSELSQGRIDEMEVKLRWAELHYGVELASRIRAYLAAKKP
jgi:hypothetical protein